MLPEQYPTKGKAPTKDDVRPSEADTHTNALNTALKNSCVVKILALLANYENDPDFLAQINSYVQGILPDAQVASPSDGAESHDPAGSDIIGTRGLLERVFSNEYLKKFLNILIVHQHNDDFLARFLEYIEKKDPAKAKQRFMDAIFRIGLTPNNTNMVSMSSSLYALDITHEQAGSVSPISLSDELMADLNSIFDQAFAIHYTDRKPSDFDQKIVFSHEEGASGESHQVVWLYKPDGTLMAMFMSHVDDGEWKLSFHDCHIVNQKPHEEGPDVSDDPKITITLEPVEPRVLIPVVHLCSQEELRPGPEILDDPDRGYAEVQITSPNGSITSNEEYGEVVILRPKKK